jgi:RHS repeat-associated protein
MNLIGFMGLLSAVLVALFVLTILRAGDTRAILPSCNRSVRTQVGVLFLLFAMVLRGFCQTSDTGFPPFGTFQNGTFDSVNLQNLNVAFGIPVISHSGRGLDFQYALAYNSRAFHKTSGSSPAWSFSDGWTTDGPSGSVSSQRVSWPCFQMPSLTGTANFVFIDPSGTSHPFNVQTFPSNPCGANKVLTGYATDGSGYFIDISGPTIVRAPDGTRYNMTKTNNFDANQNLVSTTNPIITDPNGNSISSTTYYQNSGTPNFTIGETDWTDTLGQIALRIVSVSNGPNGLISEVDYNRLAVDGTYQTVAAKYEFVTVQTNFGCSGVTEYSGTNVRLISEIDLPNGQKYSFGYEPTPGNASAVTGRLQTITSPAGGTITYQYPGANGGINCSDGSALALTRIVNDGTSAATWNYSRVPNGTSGGTTTITAPKLPYDAAGNQNVVTFDTKGHEVNRQTYQGMASGTPLLTIATTWASNNTPSAKTAILEDGSTQSQVETAYDSNGNLQTMKEYDFGQGASGPVLRTTTFQYLNSSAYSGLNIINKITSKTVADSTGTIKSRAAINYDEPSYVNAGCVTGAQQHDDTNFGCSYTTRGLPTSITTYTDAATPGGGVTKHFSYDSVGNLIIADLNCCNQRHWNFSSATQYAFADSVVGGNSNGPQLTTSATYYLTTGQIKTVTDENGQVTTYTYSDPGHLDRLTDLRRPDGIHFTNAYDDLNLKMTMTQPIQGLDTVQKIMAYDGLGRGLTSTTEDANGNIISITKTQYDVLGRPYMVSNPYTTSPQYWTTRQFDALNRPTTTVLADGAKTTSSYATSAATVTDPSGKQRKSITNGLGQVIEVDEPGAAFSGTQATGSITINDPLNSIPAVTGASGQGSFTIKGNEGAVTSCFGRPIPTCHTTYDTGSVQVTINVPGVVLTKSANYGQNVTAVSLANSLASQFSATGYFTNVNVVNTTGSDGIPAYTVNLSASAVGSATNYSYSATQTGTHNDFAATTAGPAFTGGADGRAAATDFGTIILKIGSFTTQPVCYGPSCNSTASTVASALAAALSAAGSPVGQIRVNGAMISMTVNQPSAAWNLTVVATPTSGDPADFPQGSFASQGALAGGADPYAAGLDHPYSTLNTYGVFDNLLQVAQGVQKRSYGFDDMGRVTDATTPEAGHISYQYNTSNLVTQRTDARGVITNYDYDTLNRLKSVTYNVGTTGVTSTAALTYQYGTDPTQNNNGRLVKMLDGLGSESYTYDLLGRITKLEKIVNGTTYDVGYAYNLAGQVTSITYPSGHVVQQSFDPIGRLCEIAPQTSGCGSATQPYATGYSYNAAYEMTGFNYGNGVAASFGYSPDRLQMTSVNYKKTTQTLFGLNYFYQQDSTSCPAGTSTNNGQIQCVTDTVDDGRSVNYTYDVMGRLSAAVTKGSPAYPQSNLAFGYDRYGNRTSQNGSSASIKPETNQISTLPYDTNGNMLSDGNNQLTYDAENRVVTNTASSVLTSYAYDCKGFRTVKSSSSGATVYIFSGTKVIAEYASGAAAGSPLREYIYSGSRMLAKVEGGVTSYYHADNLSTRATSNSTGTLTGQQGQLPFGDQWYDTGSTPDRKFTEYQRDLESQNDYAVARHYVNRLARFTSPDPANGSILSPQSLNRYSYGLNDPVNNSDPTGAFVLGYDLFLDPAGFPDAGDFGLGIFVQKFCVSVDSGPDECDYETLMIEPVMAGGGADPITLAKNKALDILKGKNPCADFFNAGVMQFFVGVPPGSGQNPAADTLAGANITKDKDGPGMITQGTDSNGNITYKQPYGAHTGQGAGYGADIQINPHGAFYQSSAIVQGSIPLRTMPLTIGGTDNPRQYPGGPAPDGLAAQITIIFHEFAHNMNLIPPDGKGTKPGQSTQNTQTILDHCKDAINAATKK